MKSKNPKNPTASPLWELWERLTIAAMRPTAFPSRKAMSGWISPCLWTKSDFGPISLTTLPGNGGVKLGSVP